MVRWQVGRTQNGDVLPLDIFNIKYKIDDSCQENC